MVLFSYIHVLRPVIRYVLTNLKSIKSSGVIVSRIMIWSRSSYDVNKNSGYSKTNNQN